MRGSLLITLTCVCTACLHPPTVKAESALVFAEEFEGTSVDTAIWNVMPGGGVVYVQDGWLHLETSGQEPYFPYLHAREDHYPDGDLRYAIRMQYLEVTGRGDGHTCSDSLDESCGTQPKSWSIWQDSSYRLGIKLFGEVVYQTPEVDLLPHDFLFELTSDSAAAYIDGEMVGTAIPDMRPVGIQFGHDPDCAPGTPGAWTTFKVDYVRIWRIDVLVTEIPDCRARASAWGLLKSLFQTPGGGREIP